MTAAGRRIAGRVDSANVNAPPAVSVTPEAVKVPPLALAVTHVVPPLALT